MAFLRKYGVATTIYFPMLIAGSQDYADDGDWTPVNADAEISKSGGSFGSITGTVTIVEASTPGWKLALSATEMEGDTIVVQVIDAATKAVEDQYLVIETYGHASAQHAFDLDDAAAQNDIYSAKVWIIDDEVNNTDRWLIIYYKNGEPITSGITNPDLWVYKNNGTDLLGTAASPQALTQIGSTGTYTHNETDAGDRIADGDAYIARVRATIDAATRTIYQPVGRDSA